MKAHYKTKNGRYVFEVQSDTQKGLFREIAELQEVFECETECGLCQSPDIALRVRTIDSNEWYELHCNSCDGQLSFGQHKTGGTLFVKRNDRDGVPLANRGWRKWQKQVTSGAARGGERPADNGDPGW